MEVQVVYCVLTLSFFVFLVFRWKSVLRKQSTFQRVPFEWERRPIFKVDRNQMEIRKGMCNFLSLFAACKVNVRLLFIYNQLGSILLILIQCLFFLTSHLFQQFIHLVFLPFVCRTWPSAPARHRTKQEGRDNMKSQRASSLGSLITLTPALMSSGRSSRTTSGQTPCSTTWYVYERVNISFAVTFHNKQTSFSCMFYFNVIFEWMFRVSFWSNLFQPPGQETFLLCLV